MGLCHCPPSKTVQHSGMWSLKTPYLQNAALCLFTTYGYMTSGSELAGTNWPGAEAELAESSERGASATRRSLLLTALLSGTKEIATSRAAFVSEQNWAFPGCKLSWHSVTCSHRSWSSAATYLALWMGEGISDLIFPMLGETVTKQKCYITHTRLTLGRD